LLLLFLPSDPPYTFIILLVIYYDYLFWASWWCDLRPTTFNSPWVQTFYITLLGGVHCAVVSILPFHLFWCNSDVHSSALLLTPRIYCVYAGIRTVFILRYDGKEFVTVLHLPLSGDLILFLFIAVLFHMVGWVGGGTGQDVDRCGVLGMRVLPIHLEHVVAFVLILPSLYPDFFPLLVPCVPVSPPVVVLVVRILITRLFG